MFGWILKPTYEETISQSYIPTDQAERYTINNSEFLPFFVIVENAMKFDEGGYVYNSRDNWKYYWQQLDESAEEPIKYIDPIPCTELIGNMTHLP